MSKSWEISRRHALKGLGVSLALPWLEAMRPAAAAIAGPDGGFPRRMAFLYVPNGVHMPAWTPEADGTLANLPSSLEPLASLKDDVLVFTGLAQDGGFAHGDGAGDHARAMASFLTGTHPFKTEGANLRAGISVDQVAAHRVGLATRLPSLEIGCDPGAQAGACDSGYSCAYSSNLSWRSASMPMPKEVNPRLVFERLFAPTGPGRARRKHLLDFVQDDARALSGRLGAADRRKVDEYLTSVREIEQRIARAGQDAPPPEGYPVPEGIPAEYPEHARLLYDMLFLAFRADVTRVATFVLANEVSGRSYPFLGIPEGHHELSHHGKKPENLEKLAKINRFHVGLYADFLQKLKGAQEGEGSLLDHSMILMGSSLSDGDRHDHADLPIVLAGSAGGTIKGGRHLRFPEKTPLNNLFLAMLDRMNTPTDALGDSNGRLPGLDG